MVLYITNGTTQQNAMSVYVCGRGRGGRAGCMCVLGFFCCFGFCFVLCVFFCFLFCFDFAFFLAFGIVNSLNLLFFFILK